MKASPRRGLPAKDMERLKDPRYVQRLQDLKRATIEVGATDLERLAWFVRFAAEDCQRWQSSTREARGNCLLVLWLHGYPPNFVASEEPLPDPLPGQEIDRVQREVKHFLAKAVNADILEQVELPEVTATEYLFRASRTGEKPAVWGTVLRSRHPLAVLQVLRNLIVRSGDRLIACAGCGSPILANRKQKYCADTAERCRMRARMSTKAESM